MYIYIPDQFTLMSTEYNTMRAHTMSRSTVTLPVQTNRKIHVAYGLTHGWVTFVWESRLTSNAQIHIMMYPFNMLSDGLRIVLLPRVASNLLEPFIRWLDPSIYDLMGFNTFLILIPPWVITILESGITLRHPTAFTQQLSSFHVNFVNLLLSSESTLVCNTVAFSNYPRWV